jgi:YggT family protein
MNMIIYYMFEILNLLLVTRILLSWIPHNRYHPILNFIYETTEPILKPFRNMINPIQGIDLSPIIVFFLLRVIRNFLIF